MYQVDTLRFTATAGMLINRFVTITPATDSIAYTTAGEAPDGITVGDESNLVQEVAILSKIQGSFIFDAAGVIDVGDETEVGTDGKAVVKDAGVAACLAKIACVDGSLGEGYTK